MAVERRIFPYAGQADYAQTMRVLGPIQTETSDSFTDSLLAFSVSCRRAWYGLGNGFRLIT